MVSFSEALKAVKQGYAIRLPHWNSDVLVMAQYPDEHSKMTAPYLYVSSLKGNVPWKETMVELFSEEWEIIWTVPVAPNSTKVSSPFTSDNE